MANGIHYIPTHRKSVYNFLHDDDDDDADNATLP